MRLEILFVANLSPPRAATKTLPAGNLGLGGGPGTRSAHVWPSGG